ncbi:hypothetical protein DM992_39605 (plasmid) [Burkholderia sp. JP2-270]|nr:hypothetical protein DM992_39605 [Burkholderia sp. JP2-270]
MAIHNSDCAAVFSEIADPLAIQGTNPFRMRAYRNAARTVAGYGRNIATMVAHGDDLDAIPTIGVNLAAKLREIVSTGTCELQQQLRRALSPAMLELLELLDVPRLGPKRVKALHDALHVETLEQLKRAAESGQVHEIPGFGPKTLDRNQRSSPIEADDGTETGRRPSARPIIPRGSHVHEDHGCPRR